jgi:hypothetical protein
MRPLVDNAADAGQIRDAQRKQRAATKDHLADLKEIANTPAGERFLWRLFSKTGILHTAYRADANAMYFETGKREIGLELLADLMLADDQAFLRMQSNAVQEEKRNG